MICARKSVASVPIERMKFIPPHQSLTRQLPPQGEAFWQESFRTTREGDEREHIARPHPSPAATNCSQFSSPSKGKASVGFASYIESASNFNPSINILQKNKFTLKEVSQNEKVTHHSLPLRGGRCRRRRRMRADRKGKPQHKMIFAISAMFTTFAMFAQRKEGFPSGGKKTASSLSP